VRGLCGIPDVPQTANNNINRLSSTLTEEGNDGSDGSGGGVGKYNAYRMPPNIGELTKQSCNNAIRLTLNINLRERHDVKWEAILWRQNLFIHIPNRICLDNSKEAFISLLEFAEEELLCMRVTVYFDKNRSDRNILVRLFSFIGFTVLPPNHSLAPPNASENLLYMAYNISA